MISEVKAVLQEKLKGALCSEMESNSCNFTPPKMVEDRAASFHCI